ncbi:flagellar hook-basal body complex protein FliE [Paenibacillus yanchengensis]|uniref:Flagellar hook-basal body complex protein FliE n=1 Tax=Paenibacillus yanchengensis TaxID=2035833 RepID=A0ABW4YMX8_9BACL
MIQQVALGSSVPNNIIDTKVKTNNTAAQVADTFGSQLQKALESIESQQAQVHQLNDTYLTGQVDASEVLIAAQQAQLSLQLVAQVRNKAIEAYQDIMRMQV